MDEVYECPQCNGSLTLPSEIDEAIQLELATACRGDRKIEAMVLIHKRLNLNLRDCKQMIHHISGPGDVCGRCAHKLLERGITYCSGCNSLNVNW
ncbi:MAG: hypothetical protein IPP66_20525 [Anaerolineales bacterium]|nr:hypothetical protein [Anaerolineales bacterium]